MGDSSGSRMAASVRMMGRGPVRRYNTQRMALLAFLALWLALSIATAAAWSTLRAAQRRAARHRRAIAGVTSDEAAHDDEDAGD